MGAADFTAFHEGVDPAAAFAAAKEAAQNEYGRGGYTGTIAEKDTFVVSRLEPVRWREAYRMVADLKDQDDRIDKYGPAGAIAVSSDVGSDVVGWLFFGVAAE
jgi:hypothetical protein